MNSEKLDERSLYTKLSALLCNPLVQLLSGSFKLKDSNQIEVYMENFLCVLEFFFLSYHIGW